MRVETESERLSRRRFVGYGAASAILTQAGLAQTIAPLPPGTSADEAAPAQLSPVTRL